MLEDRKAAWTLLARRLAFLAITIALVGYFSTASLGSEIRSVAVAFVLAIMLNLLPLFWGERTDPFEPSAFSGLYMGTGLLASFVACLDTGRVDMAYVPNLAPRAKEELATTVVWSYSVAAGCYLLGYYASFAPRAKRLFPRVSGIQWSRGRLTAVCLVTLAIALPVYAFFQSRLGTSFTDITAQAQGKAVWREDPNQTWIVRGILIGFLPIVLLFGVAAPKLRGLRLVLTLVALTIVSMAILRIGQRGLLGLLLVMCIVIFHYLRRRIPIQFVAAAAFALIVAFNLLGEYRRSEDTSGVNPLAAERLNPTKALAQHEEDRQRLAALGLVFHTFPDRHDYLFGATWVGLVAMPIPRWVWPEKSKFFVWRDSNIVMELVGHPTPVPYHGALYANFSWLGVVLGTFLWGVVQRGMYEWLKEGIQDRSTVVLYASLLLVQSPTLLAIQTSFVQFVMPLYLIILFVGYRKAVAPNPVFKRAPA